MMASRGKFNFDSIAFAAVVSVRGALIESTRICHNIVPTNTYTGYGISVSLSPTIPDSLRKTQVNVFTNGKTNAQIIPNPACRYCALISRTANLQANSRL